MAIVSAYRDQPTNAEELFAVLEVDRNTLGPDHPNVTRNIGNLASTCSLTPLPEAENLYRDVVQRFRRVLGPDHPTTLLMTGNLALCPTKCATRGRKSYFARRSKSSAKSLALNIAHARHHETLADVLNAEGKSIRAENWFQQTLQIEKRTPGAGSHRHPGYDAWIGDILKNEKRYPESQTVLEQTLEVCA